MTIHHEQVVSVLQRAVQEILSRGLNDPRVRGLISVTKIDLSADRVNATIHVSVMPAERAKLSLHGLKHAATHIRLELGRRVKMRRVPRLSFRLDESLKREARIIAAIDEVRRDDDSIALGDASINRTPEESES